MILTEAGDYESQDEDEGMDEDDEIEYPDVGESLVTRRVLSAMVEPEETAQRENIFHTRCTIKGKVCNLIIDGGSCTNVASTHMVEKLSLERTKHPRPYRLRWLNDKVEIKVTDQVTIPFSVGRYHDQVLCDVVPMQASHLLLGRPWQFDKETTHNGRTNLYSFVHDKRKVNLAPLLPQQVHEIQLKMSKDKSLSSKPNFLVNANDVKKVMHISSHPVLLMIFKDVLSVEAGALSVELPKEISDLLARYEDVFPYEIPPGLPPLRGIEHQIDFIPGMPLPNRAACRVTPNEAKELERQVKALMDQGYIRKSLSPCAVLVFVGTKERWYMANVCGLSHHQ